jgi:hypothetical protein
MKNLVNLVEFKLYKNIIELNDLRSNQNIRINYYVELRYMMINIKYNRIK